MAIKSRERAMKLFALESIVKRYEALWLELAEMAGRETLRPSTARYDRPFYYDFFGHYASLLLPDDTPLRITGLGAEAARGGSPLTNHLESSAGVLTESLLGELLGRLQHSDSRGEVAASTAPFPSGRRQYLGDLVETVSTTGKYHPDYVRRHILWLIKYGLAEPSAKTNSK
jgi:hypothetical protein